MSGPLTAEAKVLRALDELRDAWAEILARNAEPEPSPTALLTLSAAAERLGVARSTVSRWVDDGRLRSVGRPGARRVSVAELDRLAGR